MTKKPGCAKISGCGSLLSRSFFLEKMRPEYLTDIETALWDSNDNKRTQHQIKVWQNIRDHDGIILVICCSDARLVLPKNALIIRGISAAGDRYPWQAAFDNKKVNGLLLLVHQPCGGSDTLVEIEEGRMEVVEGKATSFVKDYLSHGDPVRHSVDLATRAAVSTHKQVLGVVQLHQDGSLYVQGAYNNSDPAKYESLPSFALMSKRVDIYAEGMPKLEDKYVPPIFRPTLSEMANNALRLQSKYTDFWGRQAVQNPEFVVITSSLKPLSLTHPSLFGDPGVAFQVSLWRQMFEEVGRHKKIKGVQEALRQADYALSECVKHNQEEYRGNQRLAFKDTRILYAETGSMDDSRKIAQEAKEMYKEWLALPGRMIIFSQMVAGKIEDIATIA